MRFLVSVIHDSIDHPPPARDKEIDAFNEHLQSEGHWIFAGGLESPGAATVLDNRGGAGLTTDGPFLESKEHVVGFWVIEATDLDQALKLAAEGSEACDRKVEVRPFL